MRRVTRNILLLLGGLLFTYIYCEFLIYYAVIAQCQWPALNKVGDGQNLRALIIADTHLLGPYRGHWLDKWRREFQMHQAFQAIVSMQKPETVFVLGDLFDEGEWTNEKQFKDYVDRFFKLFAIPETIEMYVVAGNHDIGFHHNIRRNSVQRFTDLLNATSVQHIELKGNHFVLINSMALHGDSCNLCLEARKAIDNISDKLNCANNHNLCGFDEIKLSYSRPIIMQHFPLYRFSDAACTEPDSAPLPERNKRFRLKIDSLSQEATKYLVTKLKPRVVFGGHTHHGCLLHHSYEYMQNSDFWEYSVPSFSWRNRPDPKFMLVSITPDEYNVVKCGLPKESTIIISAVVMVFCVIMFISMRKKLGRSFR